MQSKSQAIWCIENILKNNLSKGVHKFVRYADDCMIFFKSRKSAYRTLKNIIPYIEEKLYLKVNKAKTETAHISKIKYLGYGFYRYCGICKMKVHKKSISKMKDKIRELTRRSNGWSNEKRIEKINQFVRGWVNYFSLADMKSVVAETDEWLRRKIRAVYWKQCKRIKTRFKMISKYGIPK